MPISSTRHSYRASSSSNKHPYRDMRNLRPGASSTACKAKWSFLQWNFCAQQTSHAIDLLYDKGTSWDPQSSCSTTEPPTVPSSSSLHQPPLSSTTFSQALMSRSSSVSNRSTPPRIFTHTGHGLQELCDDLTQTSDIVEDDLPDQRHRRTHATLEDDPTSQPEGTSEFSTLISREYTVDDLIRDIKIIRDGTNEPPYRCKMLIDSGNPHENLISSKVVDDLRLARSHRKPSLPRRIWYHLTPWTNAAMASKIQAMSRVCNIDGTVIGGQDGTVTIAWFGSNRSFPHDSILHFQPIRYETTHVVVDANDCGADVILGWKDVKRLKLRERLTAGIRRPPTPDPDKDRKYKDYEQARAEKASIRKAAKDQKHGHGQGQPSGAGSAKQTGK